MTSPWLRSRSTALPDWHRTCPDFCKGLVVRSVRGFSRGSKTIWPHRLAPLSTGLVAPHAGSHRVLARLPSWPKIHLVSTEPSHPPATIVFCHVTMESTYRRRSAALATHS